jgi:nucleoside-diphosphate-sugar epimerase
MKNKRILLTGGSGFVGRHFLKKLSVDNDVLNIDIKEGNDAGEFFRKDSTRFDLVIHLAATVGGRQTIELAPHKLFNNLSLDSELFQWALRTNPHKVVYYSSSAAYPQHLQQRGSEIKLHESEIQIDDVASPDPSIYGWSKLTGEQLVRYSRRQGLKIWAFRPFSGYSEDQDLDYPFPSFIARGKRRDNPFEIWGDGQQVRDWIHIDDIVNATIAALEYTPMTINLCTGRPMNFNQFAEIVMRMAGYSAPLKHRLEAPVGVSYRVGDPTAMNKIYPARISLEEGIARALRS